MPDRLLPQDTRARRQRTQQLAQRQDILASPYSVGQLHQARQHVGHNLVPTNITDRKSAGVGCFVGL